MRKTSQRAMLVSYIHIFTFIMEPVVMTRRFVLIKTTAFPMPVADKRAVQCYNVTKQYPRLESRIRTEHTASVCPDVSALKEHLHLRASLWVRARARSIARIAES